MAAVLAQSGAMQAAAAGYEGSPAGSLAPSIASAAAAADGPAVGDQQEQTPVYSNAQKHPCGLINGPALLQEHGQTAGQQAAQGAAAATDAPAAEAMAAGQAGQAAYSPADAATVLAASCPPASNTTPVAAAVAGGSAAAAAAAGAAGRGSAAVSAVPVGMQTPLDGVQPMDVAAEAPSADHPLQQQQQQPCAAQHAGDIAAAAAVAEGADGAAGVFGSTAGGIASLQDMTPSSLFIASLLAANKTPTDMFLTSPLPPIGSALRQAGIGSTGPLSAVHPTAAGAGSGAIRSTAHGDAVGCGVGISMRGGQVTPLSLHELHGTCGSKRTPGSDLGGLGAVAARGSMAKRPGRGGRGGGLGVGALCTGILRGAAAEVSPEAPWMPDQAHQSTHGTDMALDLPPAAALGSKQQEDAAASGMKPDTDKAAARAAAAAAAADSAAGAGSALVSPTGAGLGVGVGSLLAAASYISTPREAGVTRGRPLSGDDPAAAEAPAAKRQRLNTGSGSGGSKDVHGRSSSLQPEQQQQHMSPSLFKPPAAGSAVLKGQAEQDIRHEADAAGGNSSMGAGAVSTSAAATATGVGLMQPPRQQQPPQHQHQQQQQQARAQGAQRALPSKQLSALQQLLQGPAGAAPPAGAGARPAAVAGGPAADATETADMWIQWRRQQEQEQEQQQQGTPGAAAGAGSAAGRVAYQQQQQGKQGQEDMRSPPVPIPRPEPSGQVSCSVIDRRTAASHGMVLVQHGKAGRSRQTQAGQWL